MEYMRVLQGTGGEMEIYKEIVICLEDLNQLPDRIEPIFRSAQLFNEGDLERLRFALVRVQIYTDIHSTQDMEKAQRVRYAAQVIERIIFGSLLLEVADRSAE
ncbi:hypothetical protein [Methanosphaerula subterraneus]|uniref:hypothetical protein n=1 Tax=Methanosphaerula subterraneus TaxID=3350244 RepID=UPI003F854487